MFVTVHCAQSQLVKFLRCHPTASALEQVRRWDTFGAPGALLPTL